MYLCSHKSLYIFLQSTIGSLTLLQSADVNSFFQRDVENKGDFPRYDEAASQLDDVRRENRTLSDEIKDLMEQISEGGRSIHEIEKQRKKLEAEKVNHYYF
jgi:hypothetical protein